jgi:cytochrome c
MGSGPALHDLYAVASDRVEDLNAEDYVHQSIVDPNAYVVSGYSANFMFTNYGAMLTDEQIEAVTAYTLSLQSAQ